MLDSTFAMYMAGAVALLVLLYLVGKSGGGGRTLSEVRDIVAILVQEAEQVIPGATGSDKLDAVLVKADELGLTKWVHPTLLRAMIESAVYWLKRPV